VLLIQCDAFNYETVLFCSKALRHLCTEGLKQNDNKYCYNLVSLLLWPRIGILGTSVLRLKW
jgi:hypothetical protein